jgi:ribosomal protein S18 acetylase RimI-like enzyme
VVRKRLVRGSAEHVVRKRLVQVAVDHALHEGCLKLVVHAHVNGEHAIAFLRKLGFRFSRERVVQELPAMEFYLNLHETAEGPRDK